MHGYTSNRYIRGLLTANRVPSAPAGYMTNTSATVRLGQTITADAATNTKGLYTELIAATSHDSYGMWVSLTNVFSQNAAPRSLLLDISIGANLSEVVIIPNINGGNAPNNGTSRGLRFMYFPGLFISAGSRIAARCQGSTGGQVCVVAVYLDGGLKHDFQQTDVVAFGVDTTTSRGTSVTPGSGSFGSWTQLGSSTTRIHKAWTMGNDAAADSTLNYVEYQVELGYGPNSSSVTSLGAMHFATDGGEQVMGVIPPVIYGTVPSGQNIYVRMAASDNEARGVSVYGI